MMSVHKATGTRQMGSEASAPPAGGLRSHLSERSSGSVRGPPNPVPEDTPSPIPGPVGSTSGFFSCSCPAMAPFSALGFRCWSMKCEYKCHMKFYKRTIRAKPIEACIMSSHCYGVSAWSPSALSLVTMGLETVGWHYMYKKESFEFCGTSPLCPLCAKGYKN